MSSYKAWCWQEKGEPTGLRLEERPLTPPARGEVRVANRAIGLNPVDWKMIEWGGPDWRRGHVPGVDGAGTIAAVGAGVDLPVGMRVAYHQTLSRDGSFAEFTCVRAAALLRMPEGLGDDVAACLPCPGLTAWQAVEKLPSLAGRDVLVVGAGGAVGLLLVQLALARDARVWATASPGHHAGLLALGVAGVFNYRSELWRDALQASLGPRKLFAAFDTVGSAHAASLAPSIGFNGHIVCIQGRLEAPGWPAFSSSLSMHEVALNATHLHGSAHDWAQWRAAGRHLLESVASGNLLLPAIQRHEFSALPDALLALKTGQSAAKRVVRVGGPCDAPRRESHASVAPR